MSLKIAQKLKNEFKTISGIECEISFMEKGENHNPSTLKDNKKGVYVFLLNENVCFKVGKANSKSQSRQYFQHSDIENFKTILKKHSLNQENIKKKIKVIKNVKELSTELKLKDWIKKNMNRIEFILENGDDAIDFDTNLLEALVQYRLKPIFEGKNA